MAKRKSSTDYIDNVAFHEALVQFNNECKEAEDTGDEAPMMPNYLGQCFLDIATNLAHRPNFSGYTFKDEMISDGIEVCMKYYRNYDPEKSKNAFAYFTQIIWFAFLKRIQIEKKQLYVKYKAFEKENVFLHHTFKEEDFNRSSKKTSDSSAEESGDHDKLFKKHIGISDSDIETFDEKTSKKKRK